ncbi:ComEC/Rec2 family competence protein [Spiroplasma endosymbiont of Crioceris asparagi]|uniref:ComEC/Rec2 family competence protein n=1 Tax=Spiroplasma endosymbiont of Crioceris asparagi TaxID=3066286 RepID=UPI0030D60AE3
MKKILKILTILIIPLMMFITIIELNRDSISYYTNKNKLYSFFVFSVGNGLFTLIKQDDKSIIFDCGVGIGSNDNRNEFPVNQLSQIGIKTIETVFISHYHYDHYSSLLSLLKKYNIKNIGLPVNRKYKDILPKNNHLNLLDYQENYSFMGLKIFNLTYYSKDFFQIKHTDQNDYSAVFLVTMGNQKILMTFDSLDEELRNNYYLNSMKNKMHVDIFMAAHHGSDNSSSELLSKHFNYSTVIISGTNNYGKWKKYSGHHYFPGERSYELFKNKNVYLTGDDNREYTKKNYSYEFSLFNNGATKLYSYNNKIIDY